MTEKYTKGKWDYYSDIHDNGLHEVRIYVFHEDESWQETIADINTTVGNGDGREPEGNANLIITAVNACIEVAEKYGCDPLKVAEQITKAFDSLNEIADYDASEASGFLDEWEEAAAYKACQKIARKCMDIILSVKQEPNID